MSNGSANVLNVRFDPRQVRAADAHLREHGAGPGGARDLLVLLCARPLVLCGAETRLSRPAPPQPQLVAKGKCCQNGFPLVPFRKKFVFYTQKIHLNIIR